jgi:hypothetical protein
MAKMVYHSRLQVLLHPGKESKDRLAPAGDLETYTFSGRLGPEVEGMNRFVAGSSLIHWSSTLSRIRC